MPVLLRVEGGPFPGVDGRTLERRATKMLALLEKERAELSVALVSDEVIHELNRTYRHKNRPTDVLAFAMSEGELGEHAGDLLGDVIVSIPTAKRQAEAAGRPLLAECTMLLAHGLLHLLGWDHDTAARDRAMRKETDRLVAAAEARTRQIPGNTQRQGDVRRSR